MVLVKSDGERAVGGENETGVALAPVPREDVGERTLVVCQRKIYILDASNVDGGGCCGFVDHFELGGRRREREQVQEEKRRGNKYIMVRGKQKTFIPKIPSHSQLYFSNYLSNFDCTPNSVRLYFFVVNEFIYYFESCSSITSLSNKIIIRSYHNSAALPIKYALD